MPPIIDRIQTLGWLAVALVLLPGDAYGTALSGTERTARAVSKQFFSPAASADQCFDGIVYDDGTVENGIAFDVTTLDLVMRFDLPATQRLLQRVCICWTRVGGSPDLDYELVFYAADGPGGGPGTFLDFVPVSITAVPEFPFVATYEHDLSTAGIFSPTPSLYIGASWFAADNEEFYLCTDEDGPGTQPIFASDDLGEEWTDLASIDPATRALVVRAEAAGAQADECVPGPATLCLDGYENFAFSVQITNNEETLQGTKEPCIAETLCVSGALAGRSEAFVRIIGPRPNGFLHVNIVRFTVSALTVTITQLDTGEFRRYVLPAVPQGTSELPGLVDREAFLPSP